MLQQFIIQAGDGSPQAVALKQKYYALRSKAFDACWGQRFYPDGPDEYDKKPDTAYVMHTEGDQLLAAARIIMHRPGSDEQVKCENNPEFVVASLLPDHDVAKLSYGELSGIVADPDPIHKGKHLGTNVTQATLEAIKSGEIKNNGEPLAVIVASASKQGIGPISYASRNLKMHGIVRTDRVIQEKDARFDTKLWPLLIAVDDGFPLLPKRLEGGGVSAPLDQFHAASYTTRLENSKGRR